MKIHIRELSKMKNFKNYFQIADDGGHLNPPQTQINKNKSKDRKPSLAAQL